MIDKLTPVNKGPRPAPWKPGMIVIHGDAGKTEAGTISWVHNPTAQVSYHYLVGRDGAVYRLVDEADRAWHAGKSSWPGMTDNKGSVNSASIGVCFANDGTEAYRDAQYEAGAELVADICRRHAIPLDLIRGHNEVSPGRKTDPWVMWSWPRFLGAVVMRLTGRAT
jgi:N-acetylmuramoyl-L-alanine amidase